MDETRFNELVRTWKDNKALAEKHYKTCGDALRELVWTLHDEGLAQRKIAAKLGLCRHRVKEIMNENQLFVPGYERLHRDGH